MTPAAPAPDGGVTSPPDPDVTDRPDEDDDALSWGDADDATHVDAAHNPVDRATTRRESDGSGALVGFGVLGGLYLLYTVAWLVGASAMTGTTGLAAEAMRVLAIMAPAMWFVTTLWVGQARPNRTRFTWLVIGAVVLIPWPFILTRSFG